MRGINPVVNRDSCQFDCPCECHKIKPFIVSVSLGTFRRWFLDTENEKKFLERTKSLPDNFMVWHNVTEDRLLAYNDMGEICLSQPEL